MRDWAKDAQRAVLALLAGFLLYLAVAGMPAGIVGFALGRWSKSEIAIRDTIHITDSVEVVKRDTVVIRQRAVAHWDTVVRNVSDTAVVIQRDSSPPDTVVVPVEVVKRDEAKDALILSLYQHDTTQQWRIASRDKLIAELSKRHPFACGRKCGFVLGAASVLLIRKAVK